MRWCMPGLLLLLTVAACQSQETSSAPPVGYDYGLYDRQNAPPAEDGKPVEHYDYGLDAD